MTAYGRGYYFERRVEADMREHGWVTIRSAGSHGPCDIIAAKGGEIRVIQCKYDQVGYLTPAARAGLRAVAKEFEAIPVVAFVKKRKIIYAELKEERQ